MEHHVAVLGLEVGPQPGQEGMCVRSRVEVRRVSAGCLGSVELDVVVILVRLADRHVADLLEAEVHRIGLPHLHAGAQDGVERVGHVEVADAAAGQTGGARAGTLLVDQHHVASLALPRSLEVHGEVVGAREPVDTGADHHEPGAPRQGHRVEHRYRRRVHQATVDLRRQGTVGKRVPLVVSGGVRKVHGIAFLLSFHGWWTDVRSRSPGCAISAGRPAGRRGGGGSERRGW